MEQPVSPARGLVKRKEGETTNPFMRLFRAFIRSAFAPSLAAEERERERERGFSVASDDSFVNEPAKPAGIAGRPAGTPVFAS